jgi:hypothetical protein
MNLPELIHRHVENLPDTLQTEVLDFVLYLEQKSLRQGASDEAERRQNLAAAFDRALALNPFAGIDGSAWQREQRLDRSLPGRDVRA